MLIHSFHPGDQIVKTDVKIQTNATNPFCGNIINLQNLTLQCQTPDATITKIDFASYGTPEGSCLNYKVGSCNAANSTQIVEKYCVGHNSCTVPATTPIFGDPCYKVVKQLVVQAKCSKGGGIQPGVNEDNVYAQGYVDGKTGRKKLLVVNKKNAKMALSVPGANGGSFVFVDETTTQQTDPVSKEVESDEFELLPFAVGVVSYPQ
eukprot:m.4425 g.4425  ORF g.4425 m.4425 type:complete len:206 (+) comp10717_c0_seq1:209-826(+)